MKWVTVTANPPANKPFSMQITGPDGMLSATFRVNEPQQVNDAVAEFMAETPRCTAVVTKAKPKPKPEAVVWPTPDKESV